MGRFLGLADHAGRRALLAVVGWYRRRLSWLLGGQCRFVPTCSCYAEEALQTKRLPLAVWLIVWRLLRCQPLCKGGFDPVPRSPREDVLPPGGKQTP
ncbi:MAG: membrane protein insertion efficiency factor YidD [Candidatus Sumerlaeia bacterium]|nr:membrane protein insertion efficiency factor YidD [Candidatus Sumerlaeia bacterium]